MNTRAKRRIAAGAVVVAIGLVSTSLVAMAGEPSDLSRQVEAALPPHVGACVLAVDGGRVIFEHAYGLADVETNSRCTPATNFRMASVSKQFTATAVMILIDRGRLSLDDRLGRFFPRSEEHTSELQS